MGAVRDKPAGPLRLHFEDTMSVPPASHIRTIRRNTLALGGLQLANMVLPLVTLPYLLRVLGPEQFGAYGLAQAVAAQGQVLADFGFNLSATQRVAQCQGQISAISRLFWSVQAAKAVLALLVLGLMALGTWLVPVLTAIALVVLGTTPSIIASVLFPQWLLQGVERMGFITLCSLLARLATLPLVFTVVKTPEDAWLAALIAASAPLLAGLLACGLIARQRLVHWHAPTRQSITDVLRDGWAIFTSTAAISLYTSLTPVVLGLLTPMHAVGLFSAADRIRQACQAMVTPLSNAAFPRIGAVMAKDTGEGLQLVRKLLAVQGSLTLLMSLGLWIFAPQIVAVLMGPAFAEAVIVLRVLAILPFLIGISNVLGIQTMLNMGLKSAFSRIVLASGLVNLALLALLAPRWEAPGAAWALVATESLVTAAMAWALHRSGLSLRTYQFHRDR